MILGIDVSRYQTTTPSLTGLDFVGIRATYGTWPDALYAIHLANTQKAGLVALAYHFGTGQPVAAQVATFLATAGKADLFVLDLERNGNLASMSLTQARQFIAAVKATGRRIGLYHSESGFPSLGQDYNWVANWSQVPSVHWTFWQYRGSPLDLDRFNGDRISLEILAGKPVPPKPLQVSIKGTFGLYTVTNGIVTGAREAKTGGFTAHCSAPHVYPYPGHSKQTLVKVLDGPPHIVGHYVRSGWIA